MILLVAIVSPARMIRSKYPVCSATTAGRDSVSEQVAACAKEAEVYHVLRSRLCFVVNVRAGASVLVRVHPLFFFRGLSASRGAPATPSLARSSEARRLYRRDGTYKKLCRVAHEDLLSLPGLRGSRLGDSTRGFDDCRRLVLRRGVIPEPQSESIASSCLRVVNLREVNFFLGR